MHQSASLDDPTRAFDDLRREVSLGLRAIQGLAAERNDQPDYSETLKAIDQQLARNGETLTAIAGSPAMQLTPGSLTQAIVRASVDARERDADMLRAATSTSNELSRQLRLAIDQVRVSSEQKTEVRWALAIGLTVGIVLWSILPGAFMRSLPSSWHAPEWMATRVMRTDGIEGARRLVVTMPQRYRQPRTGPSSDKPTSDRHRLPAFRKHPIERPMN